MGSVAIHASGRICTIADWYQDQSAVVGRDMDGTVPPRGDRFTTHQHSTGSSVMAEIESTLTHDGVVYAATIVTIERTELGREDHGIWHTMLHVNWGGMGTGIGGYVLDSKPDGSDRRGGTAYGMQWIIETVETVCGEYGRWEDLARQRCFMLHDATEGAYNRAGFNCKGIASLDGKRVMIFADVADHVAS